jgi:SRSO17 transposase
MSQVGVFLSLTNGGYHTWVDGELYFPEKWFTADYAKHRKRIGMPEGRTFATKLQLAWQMTKRVYENGLPFCAIACDSLYGRAGWLRDAFNQEGFEYYADVPRTQKCTYRRRLLSIRSLKREILLRILNLAA